MIGQQGTCSPWSPGAASSIIGTLLSAKPQLYPKESTFEAGEVQRPMKPNASVLPLLALVLNTDSYFVSRPARRKKYSNERENSGTF